MTIKKILLTALLVVGCQVLMAQGVRISGTLTDNEGPVMMGNVVERDANNRIVSATQTDFNGNFSLQVKNTKNKLVFSYVGDKTKVVNIGSQTVFHIKLDPENTQIKEVVVTSKRSNSGGLMISKKEMTTATQTFNMESVEGMAFTSADEALQGEIAGLDIVANSGNLGSGTTMRLRGVTTITGDANPLIVVDDKIFDNPDENFDFQNADEEAYASLLSVNVEDIANIQVLKDAAATAVWGSKGSNGVLLITTKRGSRGKPHVNFSYKFTGTWQPKGYTLLNGDDYTMLMKEEFYNPSQLSTATTNVAELNYDASNFNEYQNWNNNTDWVGAVTQFGAMHDWNVNLTGGGQKATFRISAGYKHQTGSIIKQKFQQFTTRMVLDYNVSDRIRFSTNFALTYTGNNKNYSGLLGIAQKIAPNMSIYRQDENGNDTGEYYIMNPYLNGMTPYDGNYSSYELRSIYSLGNPVAIANMAWAKENTYRLTPDFTIKYELLGTEAEKSRLTLNGRVDFDIYANSSPSYYPASLSSQKWQGTNVYNRLSGTETNRMKVGGRVELVFTPYFKNQDWSATMLARYEMSTSKYNSQNVTQNDMPTGITSPTVNAGLSSGGGMSSSNSRSASQNLLYNGHVSYKDGRYSLGVSLRADGDSKFGPKHKWAYFPGVSIRYNIIDEPFMKTLKEKWLSMLGLRASWGIVGRAPSSLQSFYNTYDTNAGIYGYGAAATLKSTALLDGLKLDDLKWEKTTSYNLGFNLGFLNDRIEIDFDYYHKETRDMLMSGVAIPSMTGFSTLSYINAGRMDNDGWELNFNARKLISIGKFSMDFGFNVAQNSNLLKEMDQSVLDALNNYATVYTTGKTTGTWGVTDRGNWPLRVQLNNSLGSIYGYRNHGVFQYSYDYLENLQKEKGWNAAQYEQEINRMLAEGKTFPIVRDEKGNVLMDAQGHPTRLVYNYTSTNGAGSQSYVFQGGDAIYEDVNHDGQINELDVVYLGNSLPKIQGGFNFTFKYGNWSIKTRFMYRFGNKVVNVARQNLEKMFDTYNQCASVNYRWRKDGDVTPIPRAMYNTSYNFQPSDRFVEDGGFVRFQNLQIAYNFPKKMIKDWGLNQLQAYASLNNLWVWTKYSGVDPEISPQGYGVAADASQTPRSKQFTVTLNVGF